MSKIKEGENFKVAFAILKFNDRYIFQHRDDRPDIASPGLYAGFGGAIEGDESPLEGARRELSEETTIEQVENLNFKKLGVIRLPGLRGGVRYAYLVKVENDDFKVIEGQGRVSFSKEDLETVDLKKFTPTTRFAIENYILGTSSL